MNRKPFYPVLFSILLYMVPLFWPGSANARQDAVTAERPNVTAVRLSDGEKIAGDGRLDEAVWEQAESATDFRQFDPQNAQPATERTEVRIVFDKDHLYIGVHCIDSEPKRLLGNQMVRDGFLSADDRFMWTLDPYFNQRTGYFSEINTFQYDSVSRILGWRFRFRWIVRPGNDIYFVTLNNWSDTGDRLMTLDRYAAAKIVYTHRL